MPDLKDSIRQAAPEPVLRVARAVRRNVKGTVGTMSTRQRTRRLPPGLRVELGSVRRGLPGWTTLDTASGADLYWDLRRPLPFRDGQVVELYSSHVLEHFAYPDLKRLLAECLRVLAPAGVMRVAVPDAGLYVRGYDGEVEIPATLLGYEPGVCGSARIDLLNYIAYMGGEHRHMFDLDGLLAVLLDAGFVDVSSRAFDPTLDLADRDDVTIYAIGRKATQRG
jgi:predicted SAM-dependent methyltransferase